MTRSRRPFHSRTSRAPGLEPDALARRRPAGRKGTGVPQLEGFVPGLAQTPQDRPIEIFDRGKAFREAMEIAILPRIEAFSPMLSSSRRASTVTTAIGSPTSIWSRLTMPG